MFTLNEKNRVNKSFSKCDYIRYSPSEISTMNTANSQMFIIVPRENSAISLLSSYVNLNFDVLHAATNIIYVDGNDIRLVNLGPIDLFSNHRITTSSGTHSENISPTHIVSLM